MAVNQPLKPQNKYTLNTSIQHYKDSFDLLPVSENPILTILKTLKHPKQFVSTI